jgi:DNA-3-methyladenine glycosylase I
VRVFNDTELFARLILEINQAGLSWTTILTKWDNFYHAYDQFNIAKVANYEDSDIERLLGDADIIRNKLKIAAAIHNAQEIVKIQKEYESFGQWIQMHTNNQPTLLEWQKIFKKQGFKFTGGEILREFLVSTGYMEGAHGINCPFYQR